MDDTQFTLSGENTETPQQIYNAITEIKKKTYEQYKICTTNMAHLTSNLIDTDEPRDNTKIEKIKEQQQILNAKTDLLTKSLNATILALNTKFKGQTQENTEAAQALIEKIEKNKKALERGTELWEELIEMIIPPTKQEKANKRKRNKYKTDKPLCTKCQSDRPTRHTHTTCTAVTCTNTWCKRLFHTAQQCRAPKPHNYQEPSNKPQNTKSNSETQTQQNTTVKPHNHQETNNKPQNTTSNPQTQTQKNTNNTALCNTCKSDRPSRHTTVQCRASRCSNQWCNKFFHTTQQCRTIRPQQWITDNSNNKPQTTTGKSDTPAKHTNSQNTEQKPLCNRCLSDRPVRHISPHCRAEICSNTWCNKLFHNYTTCRTPKPNATENNNETIRNRGTGNNSHQEPETENK